MHWIINERLHMLYHVIAETDERPRRSRPRRPVAAAQQGDEVGQRANAFGVGETLNADPANLGIVVLGQASTQVDGRAGSDRRTAQVGVGVLRETIKGARVGA
jgi:hypothetical protein